MKHVKLLMLGAALTASLAGCKKGKVVLRDPEVYKNEIGVFQMGIEQQVELLKGFMATSCSCGEDGAWSSVECEDAALQVVTWDARLEWHIAMMKYNGGLIDERPGDEPPVSEEDMAALCPAG